MKPEVPENNKLDNVEEINAFLESPTVNMSIAGSNTMCNTSVEDSCIDSEVLQKEVGGKKGP